MRATASEQSSDHELSANETDVGTQTRTYLNIDAIYHTDELLKLSELVKSCLIFVKSLVKLELLSHC